MLWAQSNAISHVFEVSSKTGAGVMETFVEIATRLVERKARLKHEKAHVNDPENGIKSKESILSSVAQTTRKNCCSE